MDQVARRRSLFHYCTISKIVSDGGKANTS